jgi:hypothetical protein
MNRPETLKTISVLAAALLIAYLIFAAAWLLWIALLLLIGNAFESRITGAVAEYWMRLAAALGRINSKIILTLIFFCVLTPIAFLYRMFNRVAVARFRENRQNSYFDDVDKSYTREDFEKVW